MLVASLMLTDLARIAVITVEPAVQRFSRESDAFGSSFWRESVYVSGILTFWLFYRASGSFYWLWGIAQPMDAPTEVTRWHGRTYRVIAFVIWRGQAPLNIWTCSSQNMRLEVFPHAICLSSLLSLLIMTQTPHFHALSHGNRWTSGSTAIETKFGFVVDVRLGKWLFHQKEPCVSVNVCTKSRLKSEVWIQGQYITRIVAVLFRRVVSSG